MTPPPQADGLDANVPTSTPAHPDFPSLPSYDQLPLLASSAQRHSWPIWNNLLARSTNEPDELGCLNLLTTSVKLAAAHEVSGGTSVALNWTGEALHSGRRRRIHKILPLSEDGSEWTGNDDEVSFNTQGGSQWDGFRHWAHQDSKLFYGGMQQDEIVGGDSCRNGIDRWSSAGGVTGRAVLLDYVAWCEHRGIAIDHTQPFDITVKDMESVAAWQGVDFHPGDILLIRSGFINWFESLSIEQRKTAGNKAHWSGVLGCEDTVRWLWNKHFVAIGGDMAVFEAWPAKIPAWRLHDHCIALLGIPLGEMFDLEALSKACKKAGKWSCLFTSAPINIPGGVASPPNAICIV